MLCTHVQIAAELAEAAEEKRRREDALRREVERLQKEQEERDTEEARVRGVQHLGFSVFLLQKYL